MRHRRQGPPEKETGVAQGRVERCASDARLHNGQEVFRLDAYNLIHPRQVQAEDRSIASQRNKRAFQAGARPKGDQRHPFGPTPRQHCLHVGYPLSVGHRQRRAHFRKVLVAAMRLQHRWVDTHVLLT